MTRSTSIQAYDDLKRSGKLGEKQLEAYAMLAERGPMTTSELHQALGGEGQRDGVSPRMAELKAKNLVREAGKRKCRVTGRSCIAWEVGDVSGAKLDRTAPTAKQLTEVLTRIVNEIPWPVEGIRKTYPHLAEAIDDAKRLLE